MVSTSRRLITLPQKNNLPSNINHNPLLGIDLGKPTNWGGGYLVIIGGGGVKKVTGGKEG